MQMIQYFWSCEEKCIYSKGWKDSIFAQKPHIESIHLTCESIQTSWKPSPGEGEYMKIDASQEIHETIQAAQVDDWIDSRYSWIDSERVREIGDTTQGWMKRFKHESIHTHSESIHTRLKDEWNDSNMNRFILIVNRFILSQRLFWDDSDKDRVDSYRYMTHIRIPTWKVITCFTRVL